METQALANRVGEALNEVVRAAAQVAHLYQRLQMGPEPGAFTIHNAPLTPEFQAILQAIQQNQGQNQPRQVNVNAQIIGI